MGKIGTELSHFGALWRHVLSVCGVLTTLWVFSGPFIEAYADEVLEKKLIKLGVNPKVIAELQAQNERNGINIIGLTDDAEMIRRDINAVKNQTQFIASQTTRIEGQVDRMVDALISRRNP